MAEKANKLKIDADAKSGSTQEEEEQKSVSAPEAAPQLGFTNCTAGHVMAP